ncbi:MAG: gliding motility-associated C-terminal domain-containing protein [Saprospiraceae bacterium]|nr:gliding motility-associated C-terminal domain-containing protein [Saprospiraceae bacterium]
MRCIYFAILMLSFASGAKAQACFPGADCESAPFFCGYVLENNNFVNIVPGLHTSTPPSCIGQLHNSNWFRIVPCDVGLSLMVQIQNCNESIGLQAALFDGCGFDANVLSCYAGVAGATTFFIDAIVEPGRPYFLQIDGAEGDICEYEITVLSGLDVSPPSGSAVNGAITGTIGGYCNGSESVPVTFTASWPGCDGPLDCYNVPLDSCTGLRWTLPPGSLIIGNPYANPVTVSFQNVLTGTYLIKAEPRICPDIMCQECYCPAEELSLQITIGDSCNQDCEAFNDPAPPGDACSEAPFLCGNYLDGYCSSNAGLGNDTLSGVALRNSGFLRLSPCKDSLHLRLQAHDCAQGNDLTFRLMGGSCDDPVFIGAVVVPSGEATDFIFPDIVPDETYFLVFEGGPSGNVCEFNVEVIGGIGTADSGGTFTCDCTGGDVVGPADLCPTDIAVYSLTPRDCSFTFTPNGGGDSIGNGYSCCPDTSTLDSFQLVWHIPDAMNFLSDSINVNTITVQVDSSLLGIDTMITGLIWVTYEPVLQQEIPTDSLVYCDCPTMSCPIDGGGALTVHISHEVEQDVCYLTCATSNCFFQPTENEIFVYDAPGTYSEQTNCKTYIFYVFDLQWPPFLFIQPVPPLTCNNPVGTLVAEVSSTVDFYFWTGPGIISSPNEAGIQVNLPGTYTCMIVDAFTGCFNATSIDVMADFAPPIVEVTPNVNICQGGSALLSAAGSSAGVNFIYTWSSGQSGQDISVSPASTTVYTLTVENTTNGCVSTASTTVTVNLQDTLELGVLGTISCAQPCVNYQGVDYCAGGVYTVASGSCEISRFTIEEDQNLPTVILPPVTLCAGECYTFYGEEYCVSTTVMQEDNCILMVQEIIANPITVVQAGLIGNLSCGSACVGYLGDEYCTPGQYSDTSACLITFFEIGFVRDTQQLGQIGALSCQQACVSFMQNLYCEPGNYTVEDDCTVYHFSIGENQNAPGYGNLNLNCLPDNHHYTVSFAITGTPPFKVNGATIAGTYYTSVPFANGAPYAFVIEQVSNGCQTVLSGSYDCSFMCTGNPGAMSAPQTEVCIGSNVQVIPENPPQPAPGQVVRYLLHTLPGTTPGTILAENATGIFSFDPVTMLPDEIYYLSSGIGTLSAGGALDFNNFCTRISAGQPVVFHAPPLFMDVFRENPSCFGESDGSITILSSGTAPLDYAINGGLFSNQPQFEGLGAGTYNLALRDASGCMANITTTLNEPDSLWLDVGPDQEITRGQAVLLQATCSLENPSPVWSNDQNTTTHEGIEWLVQPASTTRYTCEVQDEKGCVAKAGLLVQVRPNSVFHPNVLYRNSENPANRNFTLFAQEGHVQQINSLKIFDRWGDLVFQRNLFAPNVPELGWDGAINGKPSNAAVFVFVAELLLSDGTVEVVKGDVTVL